MSAGAPSTICRTTCALSPTSALARTLTLVAVPVLVAAALLVGSMSDTARAAPLDPAITLATGETTVYAGDSIVIEIEAIGLSEPLDLAPLSWNAELVSETGGTRIGVAGGRVVEVRSRRLEFVARTEDRVFFGPLVGESDDGPMKEIAWRWLLFPTHSGTLAVGGVRWEGEMIRSRVRRAAFECTLAPVELVVAPSQTQGDWWLPATDVTLVDAWSKDPRELSAGDEIVRTITLSARDVLASQLPVVVPLESRSIASTPIGERREQDRVGDHVTSTATFEFR